MSEKHKKDKKRKDNGEDDKEDKQKKHKKEGSDDDKKVKDKKDKKEKDKDKKKDKKDKKEEKDSGQGGARTDLPKGAMGVPKPLGLPAESTPAPAPTAMPLLSASTEPVSKFTEGPPEKKIKAWQDDELEADSGDEADRTRMQTLNAVAAQSSGQGSAEAARLAQDADSLDAYMADIAKEKPGVTEEGKAAASDATVAQGMSAGVSVMDAARVKTITLEEILAMGNGAASSSSDPRDKAAEPMIQEVADVDSKDASMPAAADAPASDDDKDDEFHAAFMEQMRKLRGEDQERKDAAFNDGSDTGEEWDEERQVREKRRQDKREAKWKAKDEKAAARKAAREARKAENPDAEDEDDDDDSEDSDDQKAAAVALASVTSHKDLSKKEKRRIRREAKLKEMEDKEESKMRLEKMPTGMKEEERLESDAEASEDSQEEKPAESYFDLVKRFTTKKTLPEVKHHEIEYRKFTKNLYVQVKEITSMKDHEVDDFRRTNGDIHVRGKNAPRPIKSFLQCGLPEKVLKILEKRECHVPFPIQMQAIPALMCGRDIIGVAQTGSGKTMAYLLPLIRHALSQMSERASDDGPIGFIVAPTRELALQIKRETEVFCKAANMRSVCAFGGGPMGEQLSALKKGCEILVGTPGRLIDVLTTSNGKITNLKNVTFLVLDEADRMFDMGFEPQIGMFLQATRPDKQVAMLSATLPTHVEALARQCLKKPIEITVGERNTAAVNVSQFVEVLEESQKFYRLLQLLGEWHDHGQVIIFVHQQKDVDEMFTELLKFGYPALALHGGQDQHDRDFTLQDFKDGVANILVATSVAARGLDCKKVILVCNFKVPDHLEDYIHRIGRTGRAGKPGFAFTFVQPDEGDRAQDMVDALRQCGQQVPEKLKRLTEEFQSQINRGEAKKKRRWAGFGGKGFKFDNTEKSRQQKDRLKAKKEDMIGDDANSDEEEVKDAWNEDKPLSAAAQKGKDKDGEKEKKEEKPEVTKETPKNTGDAAAQIAARLKAEVEAKEREKLGEAQAGSAAAQFGSAGSSSGLTPGGLKAGPGAKGGGPAMKSDEDLDAEAQAKAEEVLKNLPEDIREEKVAKLKESIKAKLVKANEAQAAVAAAKAGLPAPPPTPPPEEDSVMKAIAAVPGTLGAPTQVGEQSMVSRSIQMMQDGMLMAPGRRAAEAQEAADELRKSVSSTLGPGQHLEELEINDYPQVARQKASHREPLLQIEEMTGCKVWVKGQYFAGKMPEGAKKLYVEIIGPTAMAATKAKYEVHKMMEALAIRTLNIPGMSNANGKPGRYDPATGR